MDDRSAVTTRLGSVSKWVWKYFFFLFFFFRGSSSDRGWVRFLFWLNFPHWHSYRKSSRFGPDRKHESSSTCTDVLRHHYAKFFFNQYWSVLSLFPLPRTPATHFSYLRVCLAVKAMRFVLMLKHSLQVSPTDLALMEILNIACQKMSPEAVDGLLAEIGIHSMRSGHLELWTIFKYWVGVVKILKCYSFITNINTLSNAYIKDIQLSANLWVLFLKKFNL